VFVIPACGGGGSTAAGGSSNISLSAFPAAFVDAYCTHEVRCGSTPDKSTCAATTSVGDFGPESAGVGAGRIVYDGDQAAACVNTLMSAGCGIPGWHFEEVCAKVFRGLVAGGDTCYAPADCVSGTCMFAANSGCGMHSSRACCPGVCAPGVSTAEPSPIGGPCNGTGFSGCAEGAFCARTDSGTPTCQPRANAGQACLDPSVPEGSCTAGTYCVSVNGSSNGPICATLSAEGQPCDCPNGMCCGAFLECDNATRTCVPTAPSVAVGGQCTLNWDCVDWAYCDSTGRCASQPRAGDYCDDFNGPHCLYGLVCNAGTCARLPVWNVCSK